MPEKEEIAFMEIEHSLNLLERHLKGLSEDQEERIIELAYNVIQNAK